MFFLRASPYCLTIYKKQFMSTVGLGYITTNSFNRENERLVLPMDESVCGMIFDFSDFNSPFDDYYDIRQFFGDGQVQLINNMEEAENMGIWDNDFMNGVPYYHINAFYDYVGKDVPLYICFTDDAKEWSAIEKIQMAAGGKIFNVGIWTTKPLWINNNNGSLTFSDLCGNVEAATEALAGKVGSQVMTFSPLSTLLCPNTAFSGVSRSLFELPNGTKLNCPKLSVCITQDNSFEVLNMQAKNPNKATVGCLGVLMGCVCLAYAEENIGYVAKFNLNKNDNFENAGVYIGNKAIKVSDMQYGGNITAREGYIIPKEYDGKEAEVFFSGDPTFSNGDYYCLANNRVMHKVRRAVQSALIPYVNGDHLVTTNTGELTATSQAILVDAITNMLDNCMLNEDKQSQIASKSVSFASSKDILKTDEITLSLNVQPINYSSVINEKDSFQL